MAVKDGMLQLPPVGFVESIPFNTRRSFVSNRFKIPTYIDTIKYSFAINTQRLLQLSFWWINDQTVFDNEYPVGINLLADRGLQTYVVGDGQEGEQVIVLNRRMYPGFFCVSAFNASGANPHTLDCRMFAYQTISDAPFLRGN